MPRNIAKGMLGYLSKYLLDRLLLPGNCTVFTFHRVLSESEYEAATFQRSIAVSDVALRQFLVGVKSRFEIISLQEMIDIQNSGKSKGKRPYACITFDDGWYDNYTHAFPILKSLEVPATIFLSSDYIDSEAGFWWQNLGDALSCNDLTQSQVDAINLLLCPLVGQTIYSGWNVDRIIEVIKEQHYDEAMDITQAVLDVAGQVLTSHGLSWANCVEMSNHHISFGSHTMTHPRLSLLSSKKLDDELRCSKSSIKAKGLRYVNAICYPYGDSDQNVWSIAGKYYDIGLSTALGLQPLSEKSCLNIPRVNVSNILALHSSRLNYRLLRASLKR